MNRTCRFNKKYNKTTGLYSVSLTNLTKHQLSLFCSLFHNLSAVGPVTNYSDGVSLPCLEVRSYLPLAPGVGISYVVPFDSLSSLCAEFRNTDLPSRNVLVSAGGFRLSNFDI